MGLRASPAELSTRPFRLGLVRAGSCDRCLPGSPWGSRRRLACHPLAMTGGCLVQLSMVRQEVLGCALFWQNENLVLGTQQMIAWLGECYARSSVSSVL